MLCYGLFDSNAALIKTLPTALHRASDELLPFFWEPTTQRWLVLGLYPGDDILPAETIDVGECITQAVTLPAGAVCGIEVELAEPANGRRHVSLQAATPDRACFGGSDRAPDGADLVSGICTCARTRRY